MHPEPPPLGNQRREGGRSADLEATAAAPIRVRPLGQGNACLVVLTGAFPGETYLLPPNAEMSVGRGAGNEIRIHGAGVSRVHAKIRGTASGKVELTDLGSTNGTFINGRRQLYRVLREGDKVQIGENTVLRFTFHDELDDEFQRRLFGATFLDRPTNTLTRDRLLAALQDALAQACDDNVTVVVMAVDGIDLFEDILGHAIRDHLLRELTWIIRKTVAGDATLYRMDRESFATVFAGPTWAEALTIVERIRDVVARSRVPCEGDMTAVSLSVGAAGSKGDGIDGAEQLLALAESRCRLGREQGGNQVVEAGCC